MTALVIGGLGVFVAGLGQAEQDLQVVIRTSRGRPSGAEGGADIPLVCVPRAIAHLLYIQGIEQLWDFTVLYAQL